MFCLDQQNKNNCTTGFLFNLQIPAKKVKMEKNFVNPQQKFCRNILYLFFYLDSPSLTFICASRHHNSKWIWFWYYWHQLLMIILHCRLWYETSYYIHAYLPLLFYQLSCIQGETKTISSPYFSWNIFCESLIQFVTLLSAIIRWSPPFSFSWLFYASFAKLHLTFSCRKCSKEMNCE